MSDQSIPTPDEPTFPAPAEPTAPVPAEPTVPAPAEPGAPTPPAGPGAADDETLGGPEGGGVGSPVKDPDTWVTGDEPMTGPQRSYLDTLAREAGEELPASLTKAEASEQIDRLQNATGRGEAS